MKNQLDYSSILNWFIGVALAATLVHWILLERRPDGLITLIQNEESYLQQLNQNELNDFKLQIEGTQPQYSKIGKTYYAQYIAASKFLDSSNIFFQKAASLGNDEDSVAYHLKSNERLFDAFFDQYFTLRKNFSPDSIKGKSDYANEIIKEYNEETERGRNWISDFKNDIQKLDWQNKPSELTVLVLYDLEGEYIYFTTSTYSMLASHYLDHYVLAAQGPEKTNPKLKRGTLAFNPPRQMKLYTKGRIQVVIAKHLQQELLALSKSKDPIIDSVTVSDIMTVKVVGDDFDIVPLDEEEQGVTEDGYTQWEFDVTPKKSGNLDLYVKAGILYNVQGMGVTKKYFPVYERKIDVRVDPMERLAYFVTDRWEFIISTFLIPALSWGYARMRRRTKATGS